MKIVINDLKKYGTDEIIGYVTVPPKVFEETQAEGKPLTYEHIRLIGLTPQEAGDTIAQILADYSADDSADAATGS